MTKDDVHKLIKSGENINLEFKESKNSLNKDVFKTICAFLNRAGGHILLGVKDNGKVVGVDPQAVAKIKNDIITAANNPQKINPPVSLMVDDIEIDNKTVIIVTVPESSQVHRLNGRIYDRNLDADFDITNNQDAVSNLYLRKQTSFSENKIFPYLRLSDLRKDIIQRVKKLIKVYNPSSPLPDMSDEEMLKSLGFYQRDVVSGKEGYTLAALLLFGRDDVIFSTLAYYKTDAIVRRRNLDRYDDREIVQTNLIDAFDRLMEFIRKHLPDPFYLEGVNRISLRDKIFREVVSNILIHREYLSPYPARLIIERDRVVTENANRAIGFGHITPANFVAYPKNPKIARLFREIGRADELGSGVRNLFKYVPIYSGGGQPQLIEQDVFKIIVPVPEVEEEGSVEDITKNEIKTEKQLSENEKVVLEFIRKNPSIRIQELIELTGLSRRQVGYILEKLKDKGIIERVGSKKSGFWQIVK